MATELDLVAEGIAQRYAHPGRKAYLYLFRLELGSDFTALIPPAEAILSAWVDEGAGLAPSDPVDAAARGRAVKEGAMMRTRPQTPHERRQQMSRSVLFTAIQCDERTVEVHLLSRALAFSPKGDRDVTEEWHPTESGVWYSAYRSDDD